MDSSLSHQRNERLRMSFVFVCFVCEGPREIKYVSSGKTPRTGNARNKAHSITGVTHDARQSAPISDLRADAQTQRPESRLERVSARPRRKSERKRKSVAARAARTQTHRAHASHTVLEAGVDDGRRTASSEYRRHILSVSTNDAAPVWRDVSRLQRRSLGDLNP